MNKFQFGFRPFHAVPDAILDFVKNIKDACRSSRILSAIALDLEGAYANVVHEPLVSELSCINCPNDLLQIMVNFLNCKTLYATDGFHKSDTFYIKKGVPQGSSLSLLFAAYMITFLQRMQNLPGAVVWAYADDVLSSTTSKHAEINL